MKLCGWLLLVLVCSCGGRVESNGGESNWLRSCSEDGDCSEGSCECGMCTNACESNGDCAALGGRCLEVEPLGDQCGAKPQRLCLPRCETNGDCSSGQRCDTGGCVLQVAKGDGRSGKDAGDADAGNPDAGFETQSTDAGGGATVVESFAPAIGLNTSSQQNDGADRPPQLVSPGVLPGTECAYPGGVQWPSAEGVAYSEALPYWDSDLSVGCEFELSPLASVSAIDDLNSPYLDTPETEQITRRGDVIMWKSDLNLDGVDDFVGWESVGRGHYEIGTPYAFWISEFLEGDEQIRFVKHYCPSFDELVNQTGFRFSDATGDGVEDLVHIFEDGIQILRNSPDGFVPDGVFGGFDGTVWQVDFHQLDGEPGLEAVVRSATESWSTEQGYGFVIDERYIPAPPETRLTVIRIVKWSAEDGELWRSPAWPIAQSEQQAESPRGDYFLVDIDADDEPELCLFPVDGEAFIVDVQWGDAGAAPSVEVQSLPAELSAPVERAWTLHGAELGAARLTQGTIELFEHESIAVWTTLTPQFEVGPSRFRVDAPAPLPIQVGGDQLVDWVEASPAPDRVSPTLEQTLVLHLNAGSGRYHAPITLSPRRPGLNTKFIARAGANELGLLFYGTSWIHNSELGSTRWHPSAFQQVRCKE